MSTFYHPDDTIVAIASPRGGGVRGILRVSGPNVRACLDRVLLEGRNLLASVRHASAVEGRLRLDDRAFLPCEVYYWPTARSFTGEPAAEIHTLGSVPLLEAAIGAIARAGARLAEPGEFTLRAFLAGRLDLTQAEAVLGVVDATDPRQFEIALAQLAGGLAGPLHTLRDALLDLLVHLEAGFDFADEDLTFIAPAELEARIGDAAETVARLAEQMVSRHDTADCVRVVLRGWPNTGKSSLFNALTGRVRALVSHQPGTTRDYLTAELTLDGVRLQLIDTAGVELEAAGPGNELWQNAQDVSRMQCEQAQVEILCLDAGRRLNPWEWSELAPTARERLVVLTKCDAPRHTDLPGRALETSSKTGDEIAVLGERLREAVLRTQVSGGETVAATAARCHQSLHLAAECLHRAGEVVQGNGAEELVAAEVRVALEELGKVVGTVYTEDVLDRIFSRFCIGK